MSQTPPSTKGWLDQPASPSSVKANFTWVQRAWPAMAARVVRWSVRAEMGRARESASKSARVAGCVRATMCRARVWPQTAASSGAKEERTTKRCAGRIRSARPGATGGTKTINVRQPVLKLPARHTRHGVRCARRRMQSVRRRNTAGVACVSAVWTHRPAFRIAISVSLRPSFPKPSFPIVLCAATSCPRVRIARLLSLSWSTVTGTDIWKSNTEDWQSTIIWCENSPSTLDPKGYRLTVRQMGWVEYRL